MLLANLRAPVVARAPARACRGHAAAAHARLPRLRNRLHARRHIRRVDRSRWAVAASAWGGAAAGGGGGGGGGWEPATSERRRMLTKFVLEADPALMQHFESDAHPEVIIAMRQTITNMLGTLPPQFFRVVISTEAENLAQLMYSVLMSGYMFANAWTRLSLTASMAELPSDLQQAELLRFSSSRGLSLAAIGEGSVDDASQPGPPYAPGSQKLRIEGEVLRWHIENGKEVVPALQYIEQLELELAELRQEMEAQQAAQQRTSAKLKPLPGNELLDYLKCLSPEELVALTDCASDDVHEAMNLFVQRLMGMEEEAWQGGSSDCTAGELAQLMYWLMITGYSLRQMEQRCDLTRTLDLPAPESPDPPSLPPGRGSR